jgi:threonine/homoserine/homoserine lactone efflux protein
LVPLVVAALGALPAFPLVYLAGLGLGLSLAIPPGPVNALIAREASRNGAASAIKAGLAAPIVDTLYMLAVVFGLPRLVDVDRYLPALALLGAVLMAYLAWATARPHASTQARSPKAVFAAVFVLSVANPLQVGWWLTAGTALLREQGAWAMAGFFTAIFGWVFAFGWGMAHGARRWAWLEPAVLVISADLLLAFAVLLLARAATGLHLV